MPFPREAGNDRGRREQKAVPSRRFSPPDSRLSYIRWREEEEEVSGGKQMSLAVYKQIQQIIRASCGSIYGGRFSPITTGLPAGFSP